MFRRSSVIFAASLALLSTLDSATCFAAAAPAQPREDLERPRFLKKEIRRFVFANTTTWTSGPPSEASTSDLEALHDALTSSFPQDLGADVTPTSSTPIITTTPSVTSSDKGQLSSSEVSLSLAGDNDRDHGALLALHPSATTTPVSSAQRPSSSSNDGEGATTQSSIVPGGDLNGATGSSQSPPSSSASQLNENEIVSQATQSSTFEQPGNGVTSQLGSTAQPETSASASSAALPDSYKDQQDYIDSGHQTSGGIVSETSVSLAEGQIPSTSGTQTSPSTRLQTDTQVQLDKTQGIDALQSSLSSEGAGTPSATTSIVGSTSLVLSAGDTLKSNPKDESDHPAGAVTTATGGLGSLPVTTAGAGSSAVVPPAGTTTKSNADDETGYLAAGVTTATGGTPLAATSAEGSLAAVSGETIKTSPKDIDDHSPPGGQATSESPAPNTKTDNEGSANTNTNMNDVVPTTLGNGAGAATTHAAQPASSPFAPQSIAVQATGTSPGSETSHVTAGSEGTQPTLIPGSGAGSTSQNGGLLGSSAIALQPNPTHANTQVGGSPPLTTFADGAVVPYTAQTTGAAKDTAAQLETPPASVSSPGGDQADSVLNPSLVAAASTLNAIPASIENPLASVSGNPPLVLNPALTAAASVVAALPASVQNPEHLASPAGSPNSASPVISGGSNLPGGIPQNTAGVTGSPVGTESPVGTPSPVQGSESPIATGSPIGATGSPGGATGGSPGGATGSPGGATGSPAGESGSPVDVTGSPVATGSPADVSGSPVGVTGSPIATGSPDSATGSPADESGSPVGVIGSPIATGSPGGATGLPADESGSPVGVTGLSVATGSPADASGLPVDVTGSSIATGSSDGATGSPAGESGSPVGVTGSPVATGSPAGQSGSPIATGSSVSGSGSPVGVIESSTGATGSPVGQSGSPVGVTGSPVATGSSVSGSGSPVGVIESSTGATGSPVGQSGSPVGITGSPVATGLSGGATGLPAGESGLPVGVTGSPVTNSPAGGSGSPVATESPVGETGSPLGTASPQASGETTPGQVSGGLVLPSGVTHQYPQNTGPGSAVPESGIAGYSTQSNGKVVPISVAAGTGSTVSNGHIVPVATGQEASAQSPGPNETGAIAASNAVQSAAAVAAGATQNNSPPPGPTVTPVVPPNQQFSGKGPYTQSPVGYDTSTTQLIPTSILHGPSLTPSATQGHYFGPSSLPSNVPQILYQNGGPGSQPPNTRLINIAFRYALNYLFVYNHTVSQQQIFHYIPLGICYGLEIEVSQITMQSLRAWDTYEDVGYVTTLALAWIPEGLVDNLGLLVSTSVSRFYRNPDNSTAFLLSMINNAIPITGSNGTDGTSTLFGNIPTDTSSAKTAGAPIGGDIGNSEHVRASSVGIGVGVACGAAAYGAAMFFVARRYKKRRQSHLRSPSMFSSPVMSHAGPDAGAGAALMSGAMGERSASPYYDNDGRAGSRGSGRSGSSRHQISAPVMAENSLGWN